MPVSSFKYILVIFFCNNFAWDKSGRKYSIGVLDDIGFVCHVFSISDGCTTCVSVRFLPV